MYLELVEKTNNWATDRNMMFVVGATRLSEMSLIRKHSPSHFFLVPGVGKQGGDLKKVCDHGFNSSCGLLVNISRSILYAGTGKSFYEDSRRICLDIQKQMQKELINRNFL